jgi:hypothetical protein
MIIRTLCWEVVYANLVLKSFLLHALGPFVSSQTFHCFWFLSLCIYLSCVFSISLSYELWVHLKKNLPFTFVHLVFFLLSLLVHFVLLWFNVTEFKSLSYSPPNVFTHPNSLCIRLLCSLKISFIVAISNEWCILRQYGWDSEILNCTNFVAHASFIMWTRNDDIYQWNFDLFFC